MNDDFDVEYVRAHKPATLDEKLEWYASKSLLFRMFFGRPDTHWLIQGFRGFVYAILIWIILIGGLNLIVYILK